LATVSIARFLPSIGISISYWPAAPCLPDTPLIFCICSWVFGWLLSTAPDTVTALVRILGLAPCGLSAHKVAMSESHHRSCQCGAIYQRTESMALGRQISSFECSVCGSTLENWNTTWVPAYRLIVGPVRMPGEIE
jgi:hypothetical protein